MKNHQYNIFGFLFLLLFINPQLSVAQHSFDAQKLDSYLSALEEYDRFLGSVAILHDDQVLFQKAYGFVNEEGQQANKETVYRIGSITKTYTAAIILKMVEEGEVELSDKLNKFYPDLPNADKITIEHLLRHRSGLVSVTGVDEYNEYYTEGTTRQEMLNRMKKYGTSFEPGESYEYSNTGYILLGYIIEDITGMSYGEALEQFVTDPIGLDRTYYGMDISLNRGEAHSFTYDVNSWKPEPETHMSVPHGAGAIVSTSAEVGLFLDALFDGEIISDASLEKMTTLQDGYGMGIYRIPFNDKYAWGHNGGIDGFRSSSGHFPEDDLTMVILTNGMHYSMNDVAIGVLSILFNRDFEAPDFANEPETVELNEQEMQQFTGTYTSEQLPMEVTVFIEEGALRAQATGQGAFTLTPHEGNVMKFNPAGIKMIYQNIEGGKFQGFELQQGGQNYRFTRKVE